MDYQTQRNLFLKTQSDIPSLTIGNKKIKKFMHRLSMRENNPSVVAGKPDQASSCGASSCSSAR